MFKDNLDHEANDSLAELRELLASVAAGGLTEEQDARLQELAIESEAAWRLYLQSMFMYATIHREQRNHGQKRQAPFVPPVDLPKTPAEEVPSSLANGLIFPLLEIEKDLLSSSSDTDQFGGSISSHPAGHAQGGFWGRINLSFVPGMIMIIASALILSAVVILPIYWSSRSDDSKWLVAARVTKAIGCHWAQGEKWIREGTFLKKGELLDLEMGLAEVEFASGARVILQGPIRFTIIDSNDSQLEYGQLAASVPEGAEGFTVRTPSMNVIDLGTEFGVVVNTSGETDVHVFKGVVQAETVTDSGKPQQVQLKAREAIQYNQESKKIVHVKACDKKFIRDLESNNGVTANMRRVVNASFEVPDIRKVPEYQSKYGNTQFRPMLGWRISDPDKEKPRVAMYQISPYTSVVEGSNVGPGATDGRQVAAISLGLKKSKPGDRRSNWIFQSLGVVAPGDIGKTLKLSVDAGPRNSHDNLPQGGGMVFAGFSLGVTETQCGTGIGRPGSFIQQEKGEIEQLHRLEASVPITVEIVGQELFILLAASDNGTSETVDQYHFDNVQLKVEE